MKPPRLTRRTPDFARLKKLHAAGLTMAVCAQRLGVSPNCIKRYAALLELRFANQPRRPSPLASQPEPARAPDGAAGGRFSQLAAPQSPDGGAALLAETHESKTRRDWHDSDRPSAIEMIRAARDRDAADQFGKLPICFGNVKARPFDIANAARNPARIEQRARALRSSAGVSDIYDSRTVF